MTTQSEAPVLVNITEKAAEKAKALLQARELPDGALRVFVAGGGCSGYQYGMALARSAEDDDIILEQSGVRILVDPERLAYPGDLLHEAGHVALERPSARACLSQEVLARRPPAQSEELGVLLWTSLAAKEIGLPSDVVFHAGGYRGESAWIAQQLESPAPIGLPLLVWMGVAERDATGTVRVRSWLRVTEP